MKVHRINEMKIKNTNIINFIAGLIGIGSTREFSSAPNGQVDVKHEISQFKGSKQHGCSEVFSNLRNTEKIGDIWPVKEWKESWNLRSLPS